MRITAEQVYAIVGLKVGDKIRMTSSSRNYTVLKNALRGKHGVTHPIDLLLANDFEKVEDKIWYINDIKRGDKYYHIVNGIEIYEGTFAHFGNEKWLIENGIIFKKNG